MESIEDLIGVVVVANKRCVQVWLQLLKPDVKHFVASIVWNAKDAGPFKGGQCLWKTIFLVCKIGWKPLWNFADKLPLLFPQLHSLYSGGQWS